MRCTITIASAFNSRPCTKLRNISISIGDDKFNHCRIEVALSYNDLSGTICLEVYTLGKGRIAIVVIIGDIDRRSGNINLDVALSLIAIAGVILTWISVICSVRYYRRTL